MGRLCCYCLNITVHHSSRTEAGRRIPATRLLPEGCKDRIVDKELAEIELDVAGVTIKQKSLVQVRSLGDWLVHFCTLCKMDTFVTHAVKTNRVLVSVELTSDISKLEQDKSYSPIFKILLEANDDFPPRKRMTSMTFGQEDPVFKLVHAQMKASLTEEEELMEERIRKFEEKQRETFQKLQRRTHRDRGLLFAAIARARESGIVEAMGDMPARVTQHHQSNQLQSGPFGLASNPSSSGKSSTSPAGSSSPESSLVQRVTITVKDKPAPIQGKAVADQGGGEGMFTFDEELNEQEEAVDFPAFPQYSDDDEASTDDGSLHEETTVRQVACSLPVDMPLFARTKHSKQDPSGQSMDQRFNPDDVARSIQELALGVQDTGMFGALPKPRINSRR